VFRRSGRVTAGAIFAGLLCLFEVVSVPGFTRHNVWDWITQIALAGLIAAIMVLAARPAPPGHGLTGRCSSPV
jgi:hypothetical protein